MSNVDTTKVGETCPDLKIKPKTFIFVLIKMGKHKSKKRGVNKKRVQHRAQKLKELTANDLFMNPELLNSPQFRALPLEKQFQLTSQLKQLRMMSRGGLGAPTSVVSSGGGDAALYHQYMDKSRKVQQQANEIEQMRVGLNSLNEQLKERRHLEAQVKAQADAQKEIIEHAAKMEELNRQFTNLQTNELKEQEKELNERIRKAREKSNSDKVERLQKELARKRAVYKEIMRRSRILTPGQERMRNEIFREEKEKKDENQSAYANQYYAFKESGEDEKAHDTYTKIKEPKYDYDKPYYDEEINDEEIETPSGVIETESQEVSDEDVKKNLNQNDSLEGYTPNYDQTSINLFTGEKKYFVTNNKTGESIYVSKSKFKQYTGVDPEDPDEPGEDIDENQGIVEEVTLNADIIDIDEEIKKQDALLKQKQKNQQTAELTVAQNSDKMPETAASQLNLEEQKAFYLNEFTKLISTLGSDYPVNSQYLTAATFDINNASNFGDLKKVWKLITQDIQEAKAELEKEAEAKKKEEELKRIKEENEQEHQRNKELTRNELPTGTESELRLEKGKKLAFAKLDELMKIIPKPNQNYRNRLDHEIRYAESSAKVDSIIRKIADDIKLMNEENNNAQMVFNKRKQLIAKLNDPNKDPNRFGFTTSIWSAKIAQSRTPKQIYKLSKHMSDMKWFKRFGTPENLKTESKNAEAFLKKKHKSKNIKVFYNGDMIQNLSPELQSLSPSEEHDWVDYRTHKFSSPKKRKWYKLWLAK